MYKLTNHNTIIRLSDNAYIPMDPNNSDYAAYLAWAANQNVPLPADGPPPEQIQAEVTEATQARLDNFAKTRNYDDILSACTYATSAIPQFALEGKYAVDARDATWSALYTILALVESGTAPMPTGYEDIEPHLPALTWPD